MKTKKNSKESENTVTRVRIYYKRQLIVNSNINYEQAGEFRASFPSFSLDIQLVSRLSTDNATYVYVTRTEIILLFDVNIYCGLTRLRLESPQNCDHCGDEYLYINP